MKPNVKKLCGKSKAGKARRMKGGKVGGKSTSTRADNRKRASVYGQWAKGNL